MTSLITCYFLGLIPPKIIERTVNPWFSDWFSKPQNTLPLERFGMEYSVAKPPLADCGFDEGDKSESIAEVISDTISYTPQSLDGRDTGEFGAVQKNEVRLT